MATSTGEICSWRNLNDKEDISLQSDFCVFVCESDMHLLDLKDNKIHSRTVEKANNVEEYVKYVEHMKHIHKSIYGSPRKDPHPIKRDFIDTIHYFQNTQPKKKLFCRNKNYYLVKKSFTEGVQYVKVGEIHIYKAIARPLDIYISDRPLELKTLRSNYDAYTMPERISPGEMKIIYSNIYYIIIAPCHAYFKKAKLDVPGIGNSAEPDFLVTRVENDRKLSKSNERPNQAETSSMLYRMSQPVEPRDEEHSNSSYSMEIESVNHPETVDESASKEGCYFWNGKQSGSSTPLSKASTSQMIPPSSNSSRDHTGFINNIGTSIYNQRPTVIAIRKEGIIKSYTLRSDSTFRVFLDIVTGSFAIENDDMDPGVIEYFGEGQYIREKTSFKNGSSFETKLPVQKELLDELQNPTKKREEVVVNYFFEFAFKAVENTYKTIEATYKKFTEMRNMKMIGSCVPAIVPLSDAVFSGSISDTYDSKP